MYDRCGQCDGGGDSCEVDRVPLPYDGTPCGTTTGQVQTITGSGTPPSWLAESYEGYGIVVGVSATGAMSVSANGRVFNLQLTSDLVDIPVPLSGDIAWYPAGGNRDASAGDVALELSPVLGLPVAGGLTGTFVLSRGTLSMTVVPNAELLATIQALTGDSLPALPISFHMQPTTRRVCQHHCCQSCLVLNAVPSSPSSPSSSSSSSPSSSSDPFFMT